MASILRRLPFFDTATTLRIPNGPAIDIKHHQIIVWISITLAHLPELSLPCQRIPAVLDIGFNDYLLLREDHLSKWAQVSWQPEIIPPSGRLTVYGTDVPQFDADLWLHPNVPGFRDQFTTAPPFRLEIGTGMAVCPSSMTQLRLPLVGLSTLQRNRLRLFVNGEKKYISLRTALQPVATTPW
jgi:hypothetical protein